MRYSDEVVDEVLHSVNIVDIISPYVHLQKRGANYFGLCPFHNEKSPSFSVSDRKQMFYCFGCGTGGSAITFLMKYQNCSFQEALQQLADRGGVKLPEVTYSVEEKAKQDYHKQLLALNKDAATYYYRLLRSPQGQKGLEYLTKRELSAETMRKFGLGYALGWRNDLVEFLHRRGYSDKVILDSGIAVFDEQRGLRDRFRNRVMFPILDVRGRVIGFGGRVMGDGQPKYLNSPETPVFDKGRNLYGLNLARSTKKPYFILCEGYMDVIAMHQAGFTEAVASLGTSFTPGQATLIHRYVKRVILSYDSDGAGVRAALRNMQICREAGIDTKVLDLRPHKDPDEFIKALGAEEFQKRIDNAENWFFYRARQLQSGYQMDDPAQRSEFSHELAKMLGGISDEIERDSYTSACADRYYIPIDALKRLVAQYAAIADEGEGRGAYRPRGSGESGRDAQAGPAQGRSADAGEISDQEMEYYAGIAGTDIEEVLMEQYERRHPKKSYGQAKESRRKAAVGREQRLLLTWLADHPELYPQIRRFISPQDFDEGLYRQAAEKFWENLEKTLAGGGLDEEGHVPIASVLAQFETPQEQSQAASLFNERLGGLATMKEREKALRDIILQVKNNALERLSAQSKDNPALLSEYIQAKKNLESLRGLKIHLESQ